MTTGLANASEKRLQHSEETYVPKLTIKSIGCNPTKVATSDNGKHNLARIFGAISEIRFKESSVIAGNTEVEFRGNFEAINMEDGTVYRSGRLYLPKGLSELMERAVSDAQNTDPKAQISFAFEIRSVKASNPIGYSYEAQAIQSGEKVDVLSQLRKQVMSLPASGLPLNFDKTLTAGKK